MKLMERVLLVGFVLMTSCSSSTDGHLTKGQRHQPPRSHGQDVWVHVSVGDTIELLGPPIPLHPDYRETRTALSYDSEILSVVTHERDGTDWGRASERFTFEALKAGTAKVSLRVTLGKHGDRVSVYRMQISDSS